MAKFKISDCFSLTGRGTVLIGEILEGEISSGDFIHLSIGKDIIEFEIKSVEDARLLHGVANVGLILDTHRQKEYLNFEQTVDQTVSVIKH